MTVPVVYSLAKAYPDVRITVLSRGYARAFFEDLAPNVSFMEADVKHEYHGIRGLNALYRRLTAKNFTAIADFHDVLRSEYLRMRFNVEGYRVAHIDKHRRLRKLLTAQHHKRLEQLPTPFKNYADTLARLGYPVTLGFRSIFPEEGGNLNLLPAVIGPKKNYEQWIGIAPFAAHQGKVYPERLMRQVIGMVVGRFPGRGAHVRQVVRRGAPVRQCQPPPRGHAAGAYTNEPPRPDAFHGQRQHAPGLNSGHTGGQRMGSHTPGSGIHGLEPGRRPRRADRPAMQAVQHLRQQAVPAGRLCLHEEHTTRTNRGTHGFRTGQDKGLGEGFAGTRINKTQISIN